MTAATARASPPPCTTPPSVRWDRLPSPSRNAPRMIAASALTLTRVVTPLTAAPTWAPSTLANVRVTMAAIAINWTVAACARAPQQRAQLCHRERAADADQPESRPESHDDERIGDEPGDRRRGAEDPAADRDADDQRRAAGEPDDSAELRQANRRQTGLGIVIRWRVGASLPLSGSRANTTIESDR